MPLKSGKATLSLTPVDSEIFRGTLSVAPKPSREIFTFEFTQLECATKDDSLEDFITYYST